MVNTHSYDVCGSLPFQRVRPYQCQMSIETLHVRVVERISSKRIVTGENGHGDLVPGFAWDFSVPYFHEGAVTKEPYVSRATRGRMFTIRRYRFGRHLKLNGSGG